MFGMGKSSGAKRVFGGSLGACQGGSCAWGGLQGPDGLSGEITLFAAIGGLPTDKSVFGTESQPTDTPPAPNTRPFSPFRLLHSVS